MTTPKEHALKFFSKVRYDDGTCSNQKYDEMCEGCKTKVASLEDFAREIRNEALEEVLQKLGGRYGAAATKEIRALKNPHALAAAVSEDK